jgi:MFS family permease
MTEQIVTDARLLAVLRGPAYLSRDARIVILARALRTFGYGCTSILLAGMLSEDGVSAAGIGLLLGVAALGSVTASVAMGVFADRFGRRRSLLVTAALMGVAGVVFAVCESYPVLLVAAFIGTISPSTNDNSPFSGVEQAILAQTCPAEHHTTVFARYSMSALLAGALGGLGAAALGLLTSVEPGDAAFVLYAALSVVIIGLFRQLSPEAERAADELDAQAPQHAPENRRPSPLMCKLACLFAVDAFAGGLAVQAILALWFQQRFGATDAQLGILFFGANLLPALSQAVAPALVARYGLLGTMLVPHAVANLLLLCVPWSPTFGWAATALWTRQALSKIDVPARQAFTAAVVTPAERTAAASLTTIARSIAVSASPLTSSLMLAGPMMACGAPFLLGGGLALTYDVTMWRSFRDVAAAAVTRGRHRLRRGGVRASPLSPSTAPADTDDDPPTIATPTLLLDDTLPLNLRAGPVERVWAQRRAAERDIPRGFAGWEAVQRHLQPPQAHTVESPPAHSSGERSRNNHAERP